MAGSKEQPQRLFDLPIETLVEGVSAAVDRVVAETHAAGRWTSHIKDGNIVRIYPDGRQVVVRPVTRH